MLPGRTDRCLPQQGQPLGLQPTLSNAEVKTTLFQHSLNTKNILPQHTLISRQFRVKQLQQHSSGQGRFNYSLKFFLLVIKSMEQVYIQQQQKQHVMRGILCMLAKAVWGLHTLWPFFECFWRENCIKQAQECLTVPNQLLITVCRKVMNCFWS